MKSYYQDFDGHHCDFNEKRYTKDISDEIESNIRETQYRKLAEERELEERSA